MKVGILIGYKVVSGDFFVIIKVFVVWFGIDCFDWCNKVYFICRCYFFFILYLC